MNVLDVGVHELVERVIHLTCGARRDLAHAAGLHERTLAWWRNRERVPNATSLRAFGEAAVIRARRLDEAGRALIQLAEDTERRRGGGSPNAARAGAEIDLFPDGHNGGPQ